MYHHPLRMLRRRWKPVVFSGIVLGLVGLLLSLIMPLEYRADADVLIISKSRYGVDPYTVVKSAERVGENIAQVMQTSDFYDKVIAQPGYSIDQSQFDTLEERKRRKLWQRTIEPSVVFGTGVLRVSAYSTDPEQAKQLAGASVDTLVSRGWEYVGDDISMKVVNQPVVTPWPVRPNIVLHVVIGFAIGIFLGAFVVVRR